MPVIVFVRKGIIANVTFIKEFLVEFALSVLEFNELELMLGQMHSEGTVADLNLSYREINYSYNYFARIYFLEKRLKGTLFT